MSPFRESRVGILLEHFQIVSKIQTFHPVTTMDTLIGEIIPREHVVDPIFEMKIFLVLTWGKSNQMFVNQPFLVQSSYMNCFLTRLKKPPRDGFSRFRHIISENCEELLWPGSPNARVRR